MKKVKYTPAEKQYMKAEYELKKEQEHQLNIIYPAAAVVWWRMGWRKQRIMSRFQHSMTCWDDCTASEDERGVKKSMLQILEEESGIELTLADYPKSYHEFVYLDSTTWNRKPLNVLEMTLMRQQQKKWLPPLILAGLCLALYRDYKWDAEELGEFICEVDKLRQEFGDDEKKYADLMKAETGISMGKLWNDKKEWKE